jgi:hypothetical protein
MTPGWQPIADSALGTLTKDELSRCAVYLKPCLLEKGSSITVSRQTIQITAPSVMVFVDLAPGVNWGHPCRYLLISPDGSILQNVEGQFPPNREDLRLVHRGTVVADWMLLINECLR